MYLIDKSFIGSINQLINQFTPQNDFKAFDELSDHPFRTYSTEVVQKYSNEFYSMDVDD